MTIKEYFDNGIMIATALLAISTLVYLITIYFKRINQKIKYLRVKQKYYDIMLVKFQAQYPTNICSVFDNDIQIMFTEKEKEYLKVHFKNLARMKIEMKGNS